MVPIPDPATANLRLGILDRLAKFLGWLSTKLGGGKPRHPSTPPPRVTFVPKRHLWCPAKHGDRPAMQLMSDWWMTNATPTAIGILRAEVIYWRGWRREKSNQMQITGGEPVLTGRMIDLRLLFFILPPVCKPKENLKAKIYVIDVFNRRHKVGKVTFISHENPQFPL